MVTKMQAVRRAARVQGLVTALERLIADGIEAANDANATGVELKLIDARNNITLAHDDLNEVAALLAGHFDEPDVTLFSGGDDKPPLEP